MTRAELVRRLVDDQFPQWAGLAIEAVVSAGTDNALYRLGPDKLVRLPRSASAALQVNKEQTWLPRLAPGLPLATPVVLAAGTPTDFHPWPWSVCAWIEGGVAQPEHWADPPRAAEALAGFIDVLRSLDAHDAPAPGEHNAWRGMPLATRDRATRAAITALGDTLDRNATLAVWSAALAAPVWHGPPVWIHGDLQPANVLVRDGAPCAVIDFGLLGAGDPACDVMVAWTCFPAAARPIVRRTLQVDDATWARGRGWALSFALIALPYYRDSNPALAAIAAATIREVLADGYDRRAAEANGGACQE